VDAEKSTETEPPGGSVAVVELKAGVMLLVRQQLSCSPVTGLTVAVNVAEAAKLPALLRVMVAPTLAPRMINWWSGFATTLKSFAGTTTLRLAMLEDPLEPVTVRV